MGRGGHREGVGGLPPGVCPMGLSRGAHLAWSEVEVGIKIRKAVFIRPWPFGVACFGLFGFLGCH